MKAFVNIKTFFQNEKDRTIENLAKVYKDDQLLYKSIKDLLLSHFTADQIKKKKILLKPNFVRQNINPHDDICLFTHPNLIYSTLKVLLECTPSQITIGDAPIQNCDWHKMLNRNFFQTIDKLSETYNIPIKVVDFRKVIFYPSENRFGKSKRTDDDYLIFDLGKKSWLEPITKEKNYFRVTNYNPDRMAKSHSVGMHKFCVAKEVFEADIVITMPKSKTHRMSCITNSLKILVGINGDKDYLPHHRIGSKSQGGDCYKDSSILRVMAEHLLDFSNRHRGRFYFLPTKKIVSALWWLSNPNKEISINAGWYGNDTVWRMVMDLNTIAIYGKLDGTIANTPQRTLYTLCDAIVGGQGSGPLDPDPLALGMLTFSNDSYLMDEVMGEIFSLNIPKVPLLKEAAALNSKKELEFILNGKNVEYNSIKKLRTKVELAPGWVNYNKNIHDL